jgi:3-oxoacyl-[acyl-carrier-protein] synthase III
MDQKLNTIIESIGVYLPTQVLSTDQVIQGCKNPIPFPFEKVTGIKSRRVAGQHEFSIDLAKRAVAECLSNSKYHPADIDLLICCNISRYDGQNMLAFEPCTSIKLRKDFDFSNALVFDITNACAGMFTGIYIVDAFLKAGAIRRGMVVSGEYITHLTQSAQREIEGFMDSRMACLTLGDAGAALLLEQATDQQTGFQEIDMQTFGRYGQYCIAKTSEQGGMIMYTDSVNLTDVAVKSGAKHAMDVLERGGWGAESFQHLIMHQTSSTTLNSARNEINRLLNSTVCHDGNTINNLEQRGNTASTSHVVALADQIHNQKIQSGDKVIFSVSASGLTTGTALYIFDDLPDRLRQMETKQAPEPQQTPTKRLYSDKKGVGPRIRIESVGTVPETTIERKDSFALLNLAATNCLAQSAYQCNDIGLLIYSGVYRSDYVLEPAYAALLAGELGMNATGTDPDGQKTFAFDVFNGALGFLNACYVAQQMIAAGKCQTAMLVTAENENNAALFPAEQVGIRETASAFILDAHPVEGRGFSRFLFGYHEESLHAYTTYCNLKEVIPQLHVEKDAKLEALYHDAILTAVQELLELENLDFQQIDWIFPPQISTDFITRLSEKLNLPRQRFVDAVGDGPDLFSSSLPYALEYANAKGWAKPGQIGLMIVVGSGIQVGCAIYHF